MNEFPAPWRVRVCPDKSGTDNISIVTADGYTVAIIAKHPVWQHMEKKRLELANQIVSIMNSQEP